MKKTIRTVALTFTATVLLIMAANTLLAADKKASPVPEFKAVSFPVTDAEKRVILASEEVTVDGQTYKIGFATILRSGDKAGKGTFGLLLDQKGKPVKNKDGSEQSCGIGDITRPSL
ncbi:MAG: hypothetical protein QNI92_01970 [Desulfobacterales bacterium]|nr:hypothetical protein [Desulfobacterales bacterium]